MNDRALRKLWACAAGLALSSATSLSQGQAVAGEDAIPLPGLESTVRVVRDVDGMPHVLGTSVLDVVQVQGWMHANDRLFQMDVTRRLASGTLAELLGEDALPSDGELRTLGLRRAAELSLAAAHPDTVAALEAYAAGINAWIASNPLPAEYAGLELTFVPEWTALDSVVVGKAIAFNLSFDLDIEFTEALGTYQEVGGALGFDGTALFFEDLFRSEPFDPASTIPDATEAAPVGETARASDWRASARVSPQLLRLVRDYKARASKVPFLRGALSPSNREASSNWWLISGKHSLTGKPLLANDPHLTLDAPATFYQNHLRASAGGLNVAGSSFPGTPFVVIGQNQVIAWGATVNPLDATDMFFDLWVPDPDSPSGLRIVHDDPNDELDQVVALTPQYLVNIVGDGILDNIEIAPFSDDLPPLIFLVPRRNMGPVVSLDPLTGALITIQFTGFSATQEIETFRRWNFARNLDEFRAGLDFFDFGAQNFAYIDLQGNIAYYTGGKLPLREDLQAGVVDGLPPYFVREGMGGNEWLRLDEPPPNDALPFQVLPFEEMPQLVNPASGHIVNANNDPVGNTLDNDPLNEMRPGGGIFYLNPGYAPGMRAGRINQLLEQRLAEGPVGRRDMEAWQADVVMVDAQVFTPSILQAFENANSPDAPSSLALLGADERIAEAVERLAGWGHNGATGIDEGYDASDTDGELSPPDDAEIADSIASTLYALWRSQFVKSTIDATLERVGALAGVEMPAPGGNETLKALRNLLDNFDTNQGLGASGLDFFQIEGSEDPPEARRDALILQSLADALDLAASDTFASAFGNSTDQNDYRWGKLHRIVLDHPLGEPFSIPPAGGLFPPPLEGLSGIPVDGGFAVVDRSDHNVRADEPDEFMFGSGPSRRYVGQPGALGLSIRGQTAMPGGASGILGDPFTVNLLGRWLTNDSYPLRQRLPAILPNAAEILTFEPEA